MSRRRKQNESLIHKQQKIKKIKKFRSKRSKERQRRNMNEEA
jgi:hypothetical protein